jgi:hypothetical protein
MEEIQFSRIVNVKDPQGLLDEVEAIVLMMFPEFDFETLNRVFKDIMRLFRGEYQGYRKCNTEYHDLNHTTNALLVMTRLTHGAFLIGEGLTGEDVNLGLICALMHDTGYIQTLDDNVGTGAKYTSIDTKRSIVFMDKYIADNRLSKADFKNYSDILKFTGLHTNVKEIEFETREIELLGKMLGTADLLGQMADRIYLEKLLFLFYEFKEGGVMGYDNELDLLKKTIDFYTMTKKRFAIELGGVNEYMRYHFKARWNVDRDLYMEAVEKNISYLQYVLKNHEKDYRDHLRRGSMVKKLDKKGL